MQKSSAEFNEARLRGMIHRAPSKSHEFRGEEYYLFYLAVPRLSGVLDILPVTVPGYLCQWEYLMHRGQWVQVTGQVRSYNRQVGEKRRLLITLYAKEIEPSHPSEGGANDIRLGGFLCRDPLYRTTPLKREIADLMLAVNRPYRGSDYLPVIAWGETARMTKQYGVGAFVRLHGRFQSREYTKTEETGEVSVRVAYEISAISMKFGEK